MAIDNQISGSRLASIIESIANFNNLLVITLLSFFLSFDQITRARQGKLAQSRTGDTKVLIN